MKFGSWTFLSSQVQMAFLDNRDMCDLSNYVFSGTWDLMGCPASLGSLEKKYSEIEYQIILRRKTLFFTVNLLTPCILISFLSVLAFYLPADAQEKVTLCISILLALIVFLLLVSKSLPPTSATIPLISKYLFFTFIMNILTVIISVSIINVNFRSPRTYKMPRYIRVIFLNWLPQILFMNRPNHDLKYQRWRQRKIDAKTALNNENEPRKANDNRKVKETCLDKDSEAIIFTPTANVAAKDKTTVKPVSAAMGKAVEAVNYITQHMKRRDDYEEVRFVVLLSSCLPGDLIPFCMQFLE